MSWELDWWDLYDPRNAKKLKRLRNRWIVHKTILYEFVQSPKSVETELGKELKVDGISKVDNDIRGAFDESKPKFSFILPDTVVSTYEDVYDIDEGVFVRVDNPDEREPNEDIWVFELFYNGKYRGHIYGWVHKDYPDKITVMGIRTSIINVLAGKSIIDRIGVGTKLMEGVIQTTKRQVFVRAPLPSLTKLLKKMKFHKGPALQGSDKEYGDNVVKSRDDYWYTKPFFLN